MSKLRKFGETARDAMARVILDPSCVPRRLCRLLPGVVQAGPRAFCSIREGGEVKVFRKTFRFNQVGMMAYARECLADDLFGDRPWKGKLLKRGDGWLEFEFLPADRRLDNAVVNLACDRRRQLAKQIVSIIRDIYDNGYAHRDLHAENIYLIDDQPIVIDFEWMEKYPPGLKPEFFQSYDICGAGLASPGKTGRCCFDCGRPDSLKAILGMTASEAV